MLKERIITAIVLIAAILAALIYMPYEYFAYLIVAVFALAAWEWANLSGFTHNLLRVGYALLIAVGSLTVGYFAKLDSKLLVDVTFVRDVMGVAGAFWAFALLWVMSYPSSAMLWGNKLVRAIMGVLVIIPATAALIFLTAQPDGQWLFLYVVGVVVFADVGAYFAGRALGKKKLAPKVSPGKSWAGFFGGLLAVLIYAVAVFYLTDLFSLSFVALLAVSAIASLASVLGDLLESMVKRHRGIKDSSQILPGHGGIMDRVDSITAAAPVFTLLFILL